MPDRDVAPLLVEQVQALIGDTGALSPKREKPWASITFSGTRHYMDIACPRTGVGAALAQKLDRLKEAEFDLPGHFVADLVVGDYKFGDPNLAIEILVIIDPVTPNLTESRE